MSIVASVCFYHEPEIIYVPVCMQDNNQTQMPKEAKCVNSWGVVWH